MASISPKFYSSSPTLNFQNQSPTLRKELVAFPIRPKLAADRILSLSVARAEVSAVDDGAIAIEKNKKKVGLEKDPGVLWHRYVEWLYQHKELGLYLDLSRVGFTEEFVEEMEPRFVKAFRAMEELEKGAIANPDEGRMVGHYWLRDPNRAPNSFLKTQIHNTLQVISDFANDVITAKVTSILFLSLCLKYNSFCTNPKSCWSGFKSWNCDFG